MGSPVPTPAELLEKAERSAVHLEMRDGYMRSDPKFIAWQSGHHPDPTDREQWWRPWHDVVASAVERGVVVRRARIVSEPVSEYIRFEHDITYQNIAAGEQVRWLPRRRASDLALPGNDFWLFDGRLVLWNHFTGDGELSPEGKEISADRAVVELCATAFESVWERGIDHADYRV